jgi:GT2 family glycosyltransferase
MKTWPAVSVVVLNYNGARHLPRCFESLEALDYPSDRLELMCVDNGSSDGSAALMREQFPHVRLVETGANLGFSGGNNVGAREADGELVVFLNNDTRVPPGWLKPLIHPCLEERDVVCVGSRIVSWDGRILEFGGSSMNFAGYGFQEGHGSLHPDDCGPQREVLSVCGAAMAIRRDVFLESGGFDEDFFSFFEDSDLGWRLWTLGYRVLFAPDSVVYHRHHGSWGTTVDARKRLLYERNALFTIVKNYEDENLARVLPVALMLLLKRALHMTGANPEEYRIAERSAAPAYAPGRMDSPWTFPYYIKKTIHSLFREGPAMLATRVREEIKRRTGRDEPAYPPRRLRRPPPAETGFEQVPRTAVAHLLAADDLIRYWPRLMQKRAWIQAHRRRSDVEVFRLFGRPLELSFVEEKEYRAAQNLLVQAFGVDRMFAQGGQWPPESP